MSKYFEELLQIDVRKYMEKDYQGIHYISWATAYELMMLKDPEATYEVLVSEDNIPLFSRGKLHFVQTKVTMFGKTKTMSLPVMDNKHKAVDDPNSRQVSDCIMRCLVKNIALFGIGLKMYQKDGIQDYIQTKEQNDQLAQIFKNVYKGNGNAFFKDCAKWIGRQDFKSFNEFNGLEADAIILEVKKMIEKAKENQAKTTPTQKVETPQESKVEVEEVKEEVATPTIEVEPETPKTTTSDDNVKINKETFENIRTLATEIDQLEKGFLAKLNKILMERYKMEKPNVKLLTQSQANDFYEFLCNKKASI